MKKTLVLIILSILLLMSGCNRDNTDSSTDVTPDLKIGIVGTNKIDANIRASMEEYLNSLVPDVNGDGVCAADLVFFDLSDPAYGLTSIGYQDLMTMFLGENDIAVFIATDEAVGEFDGAATLFRNNRDYFLALSHDVCAFDLTASSLSAQIAAYWEVDSFPLYGFILDNDDTELQKLSLELLEKLLETEFTLKTDALQKASNFFDTEPDDGATILTLGTLTDDILVSALVAEYNASHNEYQIQIQCYTDDTADLSGAIEKINIQLMTGDTPDILYLDSLDVKSFENAGLLMDLSEYIQTDPAMNDENYLMNIWELFSYNDKIYELIPCFAVYGLVGPDEILPDKYGWTIDNYNSVQEECGRLLSISADTLRAYMTRFAISPYIDFENARCSFNSSEFIQWLEFIKENGTETDENTPLRCGFLNSVSDYAVYRDLYGTAKFIGYPNSDETSPCAVALSSFGMCSSTEYPEACWEFLKFMLSDNVQRGIISNFGIPLNRSILLEQLNNSLLSPDDSNSLFYGEDTKPFDESDVDYIEGLIQSINCAAFRYADVQEILKEEISVFLSGDKNATEIANIIQNRVSIYLAEQQ